MTELRKAAEMALEALEGINKLSVGEKAICLPAEIDDAMEALRQALAQTEQEPFEYWNAVEGWVKIDEVQQHFDSVGCGTIYKTPGENRVPLYTAPPKKKWVGLTDEDKNSFWRADQMTSEEWDELFAAVEAKLKEKNG
jgi:hypothetical protein